MELTLFLNNKNPGESTFIIILMDNKFCAGVFFAGILKNEKFPREKQHVRILNVKKLRESPEAFSSVLIYNYHAKINTPDFARLKDWYRLRIAGWARAA